jgi:hypothetical protein
VGGIQHAVAERRACRGEQDAQSGSRGSDGSGAPAALTAGASRPGRVAAERQPRFTPLLVLL